jgi:hypothetical protein
MNWAREGGREREREERRRRRNKCSILHGRLPRGLPEVLAVGELPGHDEIRIWLRLEFYLLGTVSLCTKSYSTIGDCSNGCVPPPPSASHNEDGLPLLAKMAAYL